MLLRGADGNYADVVFASSQQKAEEYCQQWLHNAAALSYLDVIEHGSAQLTFWTRIH
jgi:exopolysaccharide biosynthesis predicted pyruvyltransferase EpsI